MGTRSEVYLLYGWLLDYSDWKILSDEKKDGLLKMGKVHYPNLGDLAILPDYMSGKYLCIGIMVALQNDDGDTIAPMIMDEVKMPENIGEAKKAAQFATGSVLGEPALVLLQHHH